MQAFYVVFLNAEVLRNDICRIYFFHHICVKKHNGPRLSSEEQTTHSCLIFSQLQSKVTATYTKTGASVDYYFLQVIKCT